MRIHFLTIVLFCSFILCSSASFAQDANNSHVVHIQKSILKAMPMGDDETAFDDLIKRQSAVINADSRVLRAYVLRHSWGADSRDLIMVAEFKSRDEMFAFYDELTGLLEKAISKEQLDKDDALWNKYVGEHADEIYRVVNDSRK